MDAMQQLAHEATENLLTKEAKLGLGQALSGVLSGLGRGAMATGRGAAALGRKAAKPAGIGVGAWTAKDLIPGVPGNIFSGVFRPENQLSWHRQKALGEAGAGEAAKSWLMQPGKSLASLPFGGRAPDSFADKRNIRETGRTADTTTFEAPTVWSPKVEHQHQQMKALKQRIQDARAAQQSRLERAESGNNWMWPRLRYNQAQEAQRARVDELKRQLESGDYSAGWGRGTVDQARRRKEELKAALQGLGRVGGGTGSSTPSGHNFRYYRPR